MSRGCGDVRRMRLASLAGLSVVTVLLGLLLGPSRAAADPGRRKLALSGIFRDGRAQKRLDAAILRRLGVFELRAERPADTAEPPCLDAKCLPEFAVREHADLALGGDLILSELACSGTLRLRSADGKIDLSRGVSCRADWSDLERENVYADAAGELVQEGIAALAAQVAAGAQCVSAPTSPPAKTWRTWNWKRKLVVGALAAVAVGAAVGAGIAGGLHGRPQCTGDECRNYVSNDDGYYTYKLIPVASGLGSLAGLSLAGLIVTVTLP